MILKFSYAFFLYSSSFPIKMFATEAKCRKFNLIQIFYDYDFIGGSV